MPLRPFQPTPPGCIELVFKFKLFNVPLAIVIWACLDAGHAPSGAELSAVTIAGDDWMLNHMMTVLSRDLAYLSVTGTDGSVSTGLQSSVDRGAGETGSSLTDSLPSQNAQVITLLTAKRGRSFRGRTFLPGISASGLTAGTQHLTTSYNGDIFTEYQTIDGILAAVGAKQAVISRIQGGVRLATCQSNVVTGRRSSTNIETLRRRSASAHHL